MAYAINRSVGKSIEFKGLRAQYIWWLGIGMASILIVFALLYLLGVGLLLLVPLALIAFIVFIVRVYALSSKYGEHGLM